MNNEIKRTTFGEEHFTEACYPFTIKTNFSTLGSIIEISKQEPLNSFLHNDFIGNRLGFNAVTLYEEYKPSPNPVAILSEKNISWVWYRSRTDFWGKRSGRIHKLTTDVDPGYKYSGKNRGEVQWYMMGSKDLIWSISFKLKNENNHLVSFNDQSVILWSSIKLNGIKSKVNL